MRLTYRLLSRQNFKSWQTVVLPNGVIACWHPAVTFPYEHSRPLDLAEMETQKQEFLNRERKFKQKKWSYGSEGPDDYALREIFYTDMVEWKPRHRETRLYKSTAPVEQKHTFSNPIEAPEASVISGDFQKIDMSTVLEEKQPMLSKPSEAPEASVTDDLQKIYKSIVPEEQKPIPSKPIEAPADFDSSQHQQSEEEEKDEAEKIRRRERQWRNMKFGFYSFIVTVAAGVGYVFYVYGTAPKDPVTGEVLNDQYSDLLFPALWRVYDFFAFWKDYIAEPSREKLLPDPVKPPWHQPKYTIVLEMRNVLVNPQWDYKRGHYFVKRPALDYFMDIAGYPNFELVIYTSENILTAAPIIQQIDTKGNRVNHALFRDATKYQYKSSAHIKDLNRLNRDLSKVIYIDWDPNAFQLNPENVLRVPKWEGEMSDTQLVDLAELLKTIYLSDVDDVRPVLQFYSQFDNPMAEFRRRAQILGDAGHAGQKLADQQQSLTTDSPVKKYQGNLFGARRHAV